MKPNFRILIALSIAFYSQQALGQAEEEMLKKIRTVSHIAVNDEYVTLPEDSILRKHLKIELISYDQYLLKKKTKVNFLVADTAKYKKKNGSLRIPLLNTSTKSFKDRLTDDEGRVENTYLGTFPFLNAFLVETMLWEDVNYTLYSQKNGADIGLFTAMPHVTPDKKKIVAFYANAYETECSVDVYSLINGKTRSILSITFPHWMPGGDDLIFFGADGKIYVPFQFTEDFWNSEGNFNTEYRYLRVTLL
jgi:hypothetical protein